MPPSCKFCRGNENLVEFTVPRPPFSVQVVCRNCRAKLLTVWNKLFSKVKLKV